MSHRSHSSAQRHAADAGVRVQWVHAGLVDARLPAESFDLVSAQYALVLRTPEHESERSLLAAVAPGGVLLVVHHADAELQHAQDHDRHAGSSAFDPADYVSAADVAGVLGDDWQIEVDERRPRDLQSGRQRSTSTTWSCEHGGCGSTSRRPGRVRRSPPAEQASWVPILGGGTCPRVPPAWRNW